jgi:hypothetical protein
MTGVEEAIENFKLKIENLIVYPNPAKTYFMIHLPVNANPKSAKLFDVSGSLVKIKEIGSSKVQKMKFDLRGIDPGIYFLQIDNETITKKIIITK